MKQVWVLDVFDDSVSEELRKFIFDKIQCGEMSNGSYTKFYWDEGYEPICEYAKQYVPEGTEFLILIWW